MAAELAHGARVGLAVQADIVHNILAAADAMLDVCVQVRAYVLVVGKVIQGDFRKGQEAGDLLRRTDIQ